MKTIFRKVRSDPPALGNLHRSLNACLKQHLYSLLLTTKLDDTENLAQYAKQMTVNFPEHQHRRARIQHGLASPRHRQWVQPQTDKTLTTVCGCLEGPENLSSRRENDGTWGQNKDTFATRSLDSSANEHRDVPQRKWEPRENSPCLEDFMISVIRSNLQMKSRTQSRRINWESFCKNR